MNKTQYIYELEIKVQDMIKEALSKVVDAEDLEIAMNCRVCDLEDTIDLEAIENRLNSVEKIVIASPEVYGDFCIGDDIRLNKDGYFEMLNEQSMGLPEYTEINTSAQNKLAILKFCNSKGITVTHYIEQFFC